MYNPKITSISNPRVKNWMQFKKSHFRNKSDLFFVEGFKEVLRGVKSVFKLKEIIICEDILSSEEKSLLESEISHDIDKFSVSALVYAKLAYRKDTEGVIGIFKKSNLNLNTIPFTPGNTKYYIIIENIEKPGNLGAILRTADAMQANAVILTGKGTDHYNPNVIRASLGTIFSVPVVKSDNASVKRWASEMKISLYSAALPAYSDIYSLTFSDKSACVFGAEDNGLSTFWINNSDENFTIPMKGIADSLNLSVSVAITSYEFLRQKRRQ